jgi:hypothetical protein
MKKINLMDIERNLDEVALMKRDIESLNENNEKMTLNEFFYNIKVYSTIFVHNGIIIPFSIVSGKEDTYFVYCASTTGGIELVSKDIEKKTKEACAELDKKLESINYDLSKLAKKNILDMSKLSEDLMNSAAYFIIDNEYYM